MKSAGNKLELFAWTVALLFPAFIDPMATDHFQLCFFKWMGLNWCPGCGLGKSIAFFYRGEWERSLETHWFGIAAIGILLYRIFIIMKVLLSITKPLTYESTFNDDTSHSAR